MVLETINVQPDPDVGNAFTRANQRAKDAVTERDNDMRKGAQAFNDARAAVQEAALAKQGYKPYSTQQGVVYAQSQADVNRQFIQSQIPITQTGPRKTNVPATKEEVVENVAERLQYPGTLKAGLVSQGGYPEYAKNQKTGEYVMTKESLLNVEIPRQESLIQKKVGGFLSLPENKGNIVYQYEGGKPFYDEGGAKKELASSITTGLFFFPKSVLQYQTAPTGEKLKTIGVTASFIAYDVGMATKNPYLAIPGFIGTGYGTYEFGKAAAGRIVSEKRLGAGFLTELGLTMAVFKGASKGILYADAASKSYQSWMLAKTIIEPKLQGKLITKENFDAAVLERSLITEIAVRPVNPEFTFDIRSLQETGAPSSSTKAQFVFGVGKSELINPSELPSSDYMLFKGKGERITTTGELPKAFESIFKPREERIIKEQTSVGAPYKRSNILISDKLSLFEISTALSTKSRMKEVGLPQAQVSESAFNFNKLGKSQSVLDLLGSGKIEGERLVVDVGIERTGLDTGKRSYTFIKGAGEFSSFEFPKTGKDLAVRSTRAGTKDFGLPQDQLTQDFLRVGTKSKVPELFFEKEPIDYFLAKGYSRTSQVAKVGEGFRFYVFEGVKLPKPIDVFRSIVKTPSGNTIPLFTTIDTTGTAPSISKPDDFSGGVSGTGQVSVQKLVTPTSVSVSKTKVKTDLSTGQQYGQLAGGKSKTRTSQGQEFAPSLTGIYAGSKSKSMQDELYGGRTKSFQDAIYGGMTRSKSQTMTNIDISSGKTKSYQREDTLRDFSFFRGVTQLPKVDIDTRTTSLQVPVIDTVTQQKIITELKLEKFKPNKPNKPNYGLPLLPTSSDLKKKKKFKVLGRRRKKWFELGTGELSEVVGKGKAFATGSLGRSVKFQTEEGQGFNVDLGAMFRPAKREAGVIVQKSKYALSSSGEKSEIRSARKQKIFKFGSLRNRLRI